MEMEIPLLRDVAVIFGLAVLILWLCSRLNIPTVVGFLFTGVVCGPHGLGLVQGVADVDVLAQVGIMLLLFAIGLESSWSRLMEAKKFFFLGGGLQVGLTVLMSFFIGKFLDRSMGESIFLGFLLAMSSTAIVLKEFKAHDEMDSLQGRLSLQILIFQDVIAVPVILFTPFLGGEEGSVDKAFIIRLGLGIIAIAIGFIIAMKIIPKFLHQIAKVRSRELFLLTLLSICFVVAWASSSIGLSLAMGAFLAGLIISESEYSHEALGNILPFQDIFSSIFFVSTGMLLDLSFVIQQPLIILAIAALVILMKAVLVILSALCLGMPLRVAILSAIALSQIGEFSFVLVKTGRDHGLGSDYYYQLFLAVALLTMVTTPAIMRFSEFVVKGIMKLPLPIKMKKGLLPVGTKPKTQGHVVIIGYGIAGKNLSRASKEAGLPYVILEANPETVSKYRKEGEPIFFGDATHDAVLHHINIPDAKAVAIMINDGEAAKQIVSAIKRINPQIYLIVRTRYVKEMPLMTRLGADDVIPDEFGTSVEMFVRVLQKYGIPKDHIEQFAHSLRTEGYQLLR